MARVLGRAGVTLAETLLALGLCVVVVLLTVSLGIVALRSGQKGTDETVATGWAGRVLEEFVYGLPPAQAPFWSATSYSSPYQTDQTQLNSVTYQAGVFVSDVNAVGAGLKQVTVNVTWDAGEAGKGSYGKQVKTIARLVYAQ